jgi:hypothetical protein
MRFRLTAFGLHLLGSVCALSLVLGVLYLGWYGWPGWYLTGVLHVVGILAMVDVALGPTLTLIIASPAKPRRELKRDVAIIVAVQLAALAYGAGALWHGRPLYYTFSADRLEMVQASDLDDSEAARAQRERPGLAPYWYSRTRWVWAPLPDDPEEAARIVNGAVFGKGQDVIDMPRYFRPWSEGLPKLREQLSTVDDLKMFSRGEKQSLRRHLAARGIASEQRNALVLWGDVRRVLVIFDPGTLRIQAILAPN